MLNCGQKPLGLGWVLRRIILVDSFWSDPEHWNTRLTCWRKGDETMIHCEVWRKSQKQWFILFIYLIWRSFCNNWKYLGLTISKAIFSMEWMYQNSKKTSKYFWFYPYSISHLSKPSVHICFLSVSLSTLCSIWTVDHNKKDTDSSFIMFWVFNEISCFFVMFWDLTSLSPSTFVLFEQFIIIKNLHHVFHNTLGSYWDLFFFVI